MFFWMLMKFFVMVSRRFGSRCVQVFYLNCVQRIEKTVKISVVYNT